MFWNPFLKHSFNVTKEFTYRQTTTTFCKILEVVPRFISFITFIIFTKLLDGFLVSIKLKLLSPISCFAKYVYCLCVINIIQLCVEIRKIYAIMN